LSDAVWRPPILPRLKELFVAFFIAEVNRNLDVLSHSHPVSTGWIELLGISSTVSTVFAVSSRGVLEKTVETVEEIRPLSLFTRLKPCVNERRYLGDLPVKISFDNFLPPRGQLATIACNLNGAW